MIALALVWLFVAVAGAAVFASLRAWRFERREGIPPSTRRLVAVSVIFVATLGVAAREMTSLSPRPAATTPAAAPRALTPEIEEKIRGLEKQRDELQKQIDGLYATAGAPRATPQTEAAPFVSGVAFAAAFAVLAVVLVVLLGRRDTLPWVTKGAGDVDPAQGSPLEEGLRALGESKPRDALKLLDPISEGALPLADQLDLLFARAVAALQSTQGPKDAAPAGDRPAAEALLAQAERDVQRLLQIAPDMAEARYLLGVVRAHAGRYAEALQDLETCREGVADAGLPHAANESVCLLEVAADALLTDPERARACFDRVATLGVMNDEVAPTVVHHRLRQVQSALQARDFVRAKERVAAARAVEGLDAEKLASVATICDVYDVLVVAQAGDDDAAIAAISAFLKARLPSDLPDVDLQVADEALFPFAPAQPLPIPRAAYRTLFFWLAAAEARARSARGRALDEAAAAGIVTALLRALQFEPRQRDALAALGAIHYWFLPGQRARGLEWVRSAVTLGVRSGVVRRLLERERALGADRSRGLARLLDASSRFLVDPTISADARAELARELGRFEAFQPLLVDIGVLPTEAVEPTLTSIRQRASYIVDLLEQSRGGSSLDALKKSDVAYRAAVDRLAASVEQLSALERQIILDLGRSVLNVV